MEYLFRPFFVCFYLYLWEFLIGYLAFDLCPWSQTKCPEVLFEVPYFLFNHILPVVLCLMLPRLLSAIQLTDNGDILSMFCTVNVDNALNWQC